MLLELGSGYRPYLEDGRDWVHSDAMPGDHIEKVFRAESTCAAVGEGSCDEIRATHLLEHFSFLKTQAVLYDWHRALKPGGKLYIEVPHIFGHIEAWAKGDITPEELIVYVYGEQDFGFNYHYSGFNEQILRDRLEGAGFKGVSIQDIGMVLCAEAWK